MCHVAADISLSFSPLRDFHRSSGRSCLRSNRRKPHVLFHLEAQSPKPARNKISVSSHHICSTSVDMHLSILGIFELPRPTSPSNFSPVSVPSRHHDTFSSALQQFLVFPKPLAKIFDTTAFCMVGRRAMGLTGGTSFPGPT